MAGYLDAYGGNGFAGTGGNGSMPSNWSWQMMQALNRPQPAPEARTGWGAITPTASQSPANGKQGYLSGEYGLVPQLIDEQSSLYESVPADGSPRPPIRIGVYDTSEQAQEAGRFPVDTQPYKRQIRPGYEGARNMLLANPRDGKPQYQQTSSAEQAQQFIQSLPPEQREKVMQMIMQNGGRLGNISLNTPKLAPETNAQLGILGNIFKGMMGNPITALNAEANVSGYANAAFPLVGGKPGQQTTAPKVDPSQEWALGKRAAELGWTADEVLRRMKAREAQGIPSQQVYADAVADGYISYTKGR